MSEKEICRCRNNSIPLISIIIPAYNTEKYLKECIDSLLPQITDDIEIVIVDDGSTDSSCSICDGYYRDYDCITVIHHLSNMGLGVSRNEGMELSRGKYIWFLDSDDYVADDAVTTIKTNLSDELDMLLFAATSFSDGAGAINSYYKRTVDLNTVMKGFEYLSDCLKVNEYYSPVWLCVYKKNFLIEYNIRFGPEKAYEDEQFTFISYLYACNVKAINKHLVFRRYRQGSIMIKAKAHNEENFLNAYYGYGNAIEIASRIHDNLSDTDQKRRVTIDIICHWFMIIYSRYIELCNDDKKHCWPKLKELCLKIKRYKRHLPGSLKKRVVFPRLFGCYFLCKRKLLDTLGILFNA